MLLQIINKKLFRTLSIVWWSCVTAGTMVLLIAAVKAKNEKECAGLEININEAVTGQWFVEKKDIIKILTLHGTERIKGKQIHRLDLKNMETRLRKNIWIKHAELFIDNNNMLQVKIIERIPLARIFTDNGNSFYIDSSGKKLPLSQNVTVKLPVFTGFPSALIYSGKDRRLINQIKKFSSFIHKDPFWMSQVSQVEVTPSYDFIIVPTLGSHTIQFGDGNNIEGKFHKLMLFYKQVLVNTGFEKYKMIDIQFQGQVIGVKQDESESKNNSANN